jgi:phosphoglycerate dehydrogenase-like enzyme
MFREPFHVDASNGQPNPSLRFHDSQKLQCFRGFAKTHSTNAKGFGQLGFRREPITWAKLLRDDELLAQSDIVTLHCPSTPQTKKLLNDDSLGRMKQGSVVVNLGRGDLIDSGSLIAALQSGKISAAALDVFEQEPLPPENLLRFMPNVITASHIASASPKSVRTLRETAAKIAIMALRGDPLPNIVN